VRYKELQQSALSSACAALVVRRSLTPAASGALKSNRVGRRHGGVFDAVCLQSTQDRLHDPLSLGTRRLFQLQIFQEHRLEITTVTKPELRHITHAAPMHLKNVPFNGNSSIMTSGCVP